MNTVELQHEVCGQCKSGVLKEIKHNGTPIASNWSALTQYIYAYDETEPRITTSSTVVIPQCKKCQKPTRAERVRKALETKANKRR